MVSRSSSPERSRRSSVSSRRRSSAAENQPQILMRYNIFHRLLACMGLKSVLETGHVVHIGYDKRPLGALIVFLILNAVLLSPELFFSWINFPTSDWTVFCEDYSEKLVQTEEKIKNITNYDAAYQQAIFTNQTEAAIEAIVSNWINWPEGCSSEIYLALMQARQETRYCEAEVALSTGSGFLDWGVQLISDIDLSPTVSYPCYTSPTLTGSIFDDYYNYQAEIAARVTPTIESIQVQANTAVADFVSLLLERADVASDIYIGYVIFAMLVAPPIKIFKASLQTRLLGTTGGISKPTWIFTIVLIWTSYELIIDALSSLQLSLFFTNFIRDPCYADPSFIKDQVQVVTNVCLNMSEFKKEWQQSFYAIEDMNATADMYTNCYAAYTTPFKTVVALANSVNGTFMGECVSKDLASMVTVVESDSNTDYVGILIASGIICQVLFKFVLTNLVYHSCCLFDPMIACRGKIEYPVAQVEKREADRIRRFQRDQHWLPLLQTLVFLLIIIIDFIIVSQNVDISALREKYDFI